MAHFGYSYKPVAGQKVSMAQANDLNASYKDLSQVCANLKGKGAGDAVAFLEKASKGEIPVLYRKYNKRLGHRKQLGGKKGRFPKKSARLVLKVLRNAIANATFKGLSDSLVVIHACANKQSTFARLAPKGRRVRSDMETSRIEIILREVPPRKGTQAPKVVKKEKKKEEEKQKAVV